MQQSMVFISMDLPYASGFRMSKKNSRRNFRCIPPQDAFVMIKEKIFASSVRSCTVYGPCIPRALSKAVGYPKFKVFVHNVLLSLRNPIHERRHIREDDSMVTLTDDSF